MNQLNDIMHQKVLDEIARLTNHGSESIVFAYRYGLCFKFYLDLKLRFHCAKAYYDSDHVIVHLFGRYYDSTGEVARVRHIDMIEHYPELYADWFIEYGSAKGNL